MDTQTDFAYERLYAYKYMGGVDVCVSALKILAVVVHCMHWYVLHVRIRTLQHTFACSCACSGIRVCGRGIVFFFFFVIFNFSIFVYSYIRGNMSGNML